MSRGCWRVSASRELRDLWLGGRGVPVTFAYTLLLSATTYLVASNQALNFLEQREAVSLTLQIAVAVGSLLVLLASADAVSSERERGTLETLLLSPAPRRSLVMGKAVGAFSLWCGCFALTVPYMWALGHGVGTVAQSVGTGFLMGTLLALFLIGLGLSITILASSSKVSVAVALLPLLALYAPTQLPSQAQNGWFGEVLLRVDPFTAGLHVIGAVLVDGQGFTQQASWIAGVAVSAVCSCSVAFALAGRLRLAGWRAL